MKYVSGTFVALMSSGGTLSATIILARKAVTILMIFQLSVVPESTFYLKSNAIHCQEDFNDIHFQKIAVQLSIFFC